ncbi:MAG TPA: histidine phosphatase family protein [Candidatus Saccharimonadales bacterium]|nr:histidine phosphatase family protein [Candidatus Saccharimonadales bacterium]
MKLYLIRHGQTAANLRPADFPWDNDCPLTPEGQTQARHTAAWLHRQGVRPTHVLASPKVRAQQTAGILGAALGRAPQPDARLTEMDGGQWHGRPVQEVAAYIHGLPIDERFLFAPPGGESWQACGGRLVALIQEHITEVELLLVSHYAPLQAAVGTLLQAPFAEWGTYDFPNASVTLLEYHGGNWRAVYIGRPPSA